MLHIPASIGTQRSADAFCSCFTSFCASVLLHIFPFSLRRQVCMDVRYRNLSQRARCGDVHAAQHYRVRCLLQVNNEFCTLGLCDMSKATVRVCMCICIFACVSVSVSLCVSVC